MSCLQPRPWQNKAECGKYSFMPNAFPSKVLLREDGPREGFQMLPHFVSTEDKLELIRRLSDTGVTSIEATAFVRPDLVPQLADAEQLAEKLPDRSDVRYRALYLNPRGFERALACSRLSVEGYLLIAASETFLRNNNNQTLDEAIAGIPEWLELFADRGVVLERVMLSTAWGDNDEGRIEAPQVIKLCERLFAALPGGPADIPELTLADTSGLASPLRVQRLIGELKTRWPEQRLGLHLHDTRGTGMPNVYAGLMEGIDRFDCSVAGLGGCPFTPGAAGNVPTEDVAFLCAELGIETGVDLERYIDCALFAEQLAGRPLPGKLKNGGVIHAGA